MKISVFNNLFFFLLAFAMFYVSLFTFRSETAELVYKIPDDASYYLKIAENFNNGFGMSFDSINKTNGYQPLWQYAAIIVSVFTGNNPDKTLRVILFMQLILVTLTALLFHKIITDYFGSIVSLGCGIIYLVFVFPLCINGMETALTFLILIFLFKLLLDYDYLNKYILKTDIFISAVAGILVLSRLDMIFFAVSIICIFLFRSITDFNQRKKYIRKTIVLTLTITVVLLPYLIYNLGEFGNILPISGYLKTGISDLPLSEKLSGLLLYRESYFAFTAFVFPIIYFFKSIKSEAETERSFYIAVLLYSLCCIFLYLFLLFFVDWVIFYWYFVPFAVFFAFFSAVMFRYIVNLKIFKSGLIIYFSLLIFILFYWGNKQIVNFSSESDTLSSNWNLESFKASQWARENSNTDEVFAMKDAGHFGFFSGRKVINLDGLVNNFEFQDILRDKRLGDYLKRNNVKYLAQHALWDRDDITDGAYDSLKLELKSRRYSVNSDPVVLFKKNEVYRSGPYLDGDKRVSFIIWKLN